MGVRAEQGGLPGSLLVWPALTPVHGVSCMQVEAPFGRDYNDLPSDAIMAEIIRTARMLCASEVGMARRGGVDLSAAALTRVGAACCQWRMMVCSCLVPPSDTRNAVHSHCFICGTTYPAAAGCDGS